MLMKKRKEKIEMGTSFALSDLPELTLREFRRLEDTLRKKSHQLPSPCVGILVIDATNTLQGIHEDDIRYLAERAFRRNPRPNILGVFVVRSYKFYRRESEPEAIYIGNPCCKEAGLERMLSCFKAFSRTRPIV